jgi:hypothetical protein
MSALVAGHFIRGKMAGMKQFSIRDLGWLTLMVAVLLVWWIDHRNLMNRNRFTVETVTTPGGEPTVLRDNATGEILIKKNDTWLVGRMVEPIHEGK